MTKAASTCGPLPSKWENIEDGMPPELNIYSFRAFLCPRRIQLKLNNKGCQGQICTKYLLAIIGILGHTINARPVELGEGPKKAMEMMKGQKDNTGKKTRGELFENGKDLEWCLNDSLSIIFLCWKVAAQEAPPTGDTPLTTRWSPFMFKLLALSSY